MISFFYLFTGGILPAPEVIEIYKIKPYKYLVVNSRSFDFARNRVASFKGCVKSAEVAE
ncbi:MAG: hypothetical protein V1903_13650 [Bacteroidota bacterium]